MFDFSKKPAFGLDLNDLSFKIVQLRKKKDKIYIASLLKEDIPAGLIKRGEIKKEKELAELIKKAIYKVKGNSLQTNRVICNLPEEKIFIRMIQLPIMEKQEVAKAVRWEVEAHIPLSIDEVYLDWQIIKPLKKDISHLDILVAVTPMGSVDSYSSLLKKSGLEPVALEPESVAAVRSLIPNGKAKPTIIIDLGISGTNFVIFSACCVRFTSRSGTSGQLFNQAIAKRLKVDKKKANQLKIKVGLDKTVQKGEVYRALEPIVNDMAKQIKEYMGFYHSHVDHLHGVDKTVGQGLLCGGDSLLIGLPSYLSNKLRLPVQIGNPLINIASFGKRGKSADGFSLSKKESLVYTIALGLALRDFI